MTRTEAVPLISIVLTLLMVTIIGSLIAWALWNVPAQAQGLLPTVIERLPESGVSAQVTAVLLNFRSHDTLLEVVVLLVALLGVWYQGGMHVPEKEQQPGPVLESLVRLLVPVMILVTGYILWLGGIVAGGAFQAGALLAGAGVLMLVVRAEILGLRDGTALRSLLVAGPAVFALVGAGVMLSGRNMLQYPPEHAGSLILLIEGASVLTIGITLTLLFAGGRPGRGDLP